MPAPALPPAPSPTAGRVEAPYAYVVEYRPLDHCFPPSCRIRTRSAEGFAHQILSDGDPGGYVRQGKDGGIETTFQRGVELRPRASFELDLPPADHDSELDVYLSSAVPDTTFEATFTVSTGIAPATTTLDEQHITGKTLSPAKNEAGRTERFARHVRVRLPARKNRTIHIAITNTDGTHRLAVGSPVVMKRVDREPRQALLSVFDAVPFHIMRGLLYEGNEDAKADWFRKDVAERGIFFSRGMSLGQGTGPFVCRFITGQYFKGHGWPGAWDEGAEPQVPEFLGGPLARAASIGFLTHFVGHNQYFVPNQIWNGVDSGNQSELEHPNAIVRGMEQWTRDHPHDDAIILWWWSATHSPYGPGRKGPIGPPIALGSDQVNKNRIERVWGNALDGMDRLEESYGFLKKAAPNASRVMWLSADHSSGISTRMARRPYRTVDRVSTDVGHGCGGTAEESNAPFAVFFDGEGKGVSQHVTDEPTMSFVAWGAIERHFDVDLGLPRTTSFTSPVFPELAPPLWTDHVFVSVGAAGTVRAVAGNMAYVWFNRKLSQFPIWKYSSEGEQRLIVGAPTRSGGVIDEELYDNGADPYELVNVAGPRFDKTLEMRRELADWMATHFDESTRPRHSYRLVFDKVRDLELFAPQPFKLMADGVLVASADERLARVRAKELVIIERDEPAAIVELRGVSEPFILRCSANGLPLDAIGVGRARLNLAVARVNCPLPPGIHDQAGPGEILFSFEPAPAGTPTSQGGTVQLGQPTSPTGPNEELYQGMKRWGYVRDIDEAKK
jgi:hypothetical protein